MDIHYPQYKDSFRYTLPRPYILRTLLFVESSSGQGSTVEALAQDLPMLKLAT